MKKSLSPEAKAILEMTSDTVGKDLLSAMMDEIRLMPDVWVKIAQNKQDDIIERLRNRIKHNVQMAVHLIASGGRVCVAGDLEQITIKDGVKAVVRIGSSEPNLHHLYDNANKAVLVVVADGADHTQGMDEINGDPDQRTIDDVPVAQTSRIKHHEKDENTIDGEVA